MQMGLDLGHELVIDLFAGGGGASLGMEWALGRAPDIAVNHDPQAVAQHQANHPGTVHFCESVFKVNPREVTKDQPVGLLWASPDCLPAGTLILTADGYRPIEAVKVGDFVLTHRGRYRRVTRTMTTTKPLLKVCGQGHPGLLVTAEHPFYARQAHNVWNNERRAYDRTLRDPEWVKPSELRTTGAPMNAAGGDLSFWATPCKFPELPIPAVGGRGMSITAPLMWLAGRYLGDGWTRISGTRAELVITCGKGEVDQLRQQLGQWKRKGLRSGEDELAWHERHTETAYQFSTNHRGLVEWLRSELGHGAHEKSIPAWALGMDANLRQSLLDGYLSADGHTRTISGSQVSEVQTASKPLAFGVRSLVESLGMTAQVHGPFANRTQIDGRSFNARPSWKVRWRESARRLQNVREDMHNWTRLQSVADASQVAEVFNLSVEEDESYIAEGVITHNCTHHSKAKGGKPVKKQIRGLAWVVVKWARRTRPRAIMLENVEEFREWGPLDETGRPCKRRKGQQFDEWIRQIERLGYRVEYRLLRACDYGAPTIRKRLFLVARRDGLSIQWPEPTHGPADSLAVKRGKLQPYRTAAECIDWTIPCPSIFDRPRPLAENTMRRIARGVQRFVLEAAEPFIVTCNHAGAGFRGQGLSDPMKTVTSAYDAHGLCTPFVVKQRQGATGHRADQPLHTITAGGKQARPGTGNAMSVAVPYFIPRHGERQGQDPRTRSVEDPLPTVTGTANGASLVAAFMAKHYGGNYDGPGNDPRDPVSTITARDHNAVVAAHISTYYGGSDSDRRGSGLDEPVATQTTENRHALVAALMAPYYGSGSGETGRDLHDPAPTVTSKDRLQLVTVTINGETYVLTDIGMRMLQPHELYAAQGFPPDYIIDRGPDGRRLPKHSQVRMCGNSVAPPVAAALVEANFSHEKQATKEVA